MKKQLLLTNGNVSTSETSATSSSCDQELELNDQFWEAVGPKFNDLQRSLDPHPTVVIDDKHHIEVFVGGSNRDYRGLSRVSMEQHFANIHKREQKAISLCQTLRDRVETLEEELANARQRTLEMHRNKTITVNQIRDFWRNKVLEQRSRGGMMLLASLRESS